MMAKRLVSPLTLLAVLVAVAVAIALLWPRSEVIHADYPYYGSLESLTGRADVVVLGEVQKTSVRRDTATDLVVTDATVRVLETIKGANVPAVILVHQMGGTIGTVTYKEHGAVPYQKGQQFVLFLAKMPNQRYMALNPSQGSLLVANDSSVTFSKQKVALKDLLERTKRAPDTRTPAQRSAAGD